jgi:BirA family biotin operon repressor/biotin-[acetyl-CoA-carboxylase] ligase
MPFLAHLERLGRVDSTQRVVADRLAAGEPEVIVAVADEQTRGRGRLGRRWVAPPGAALLLSCGFRPTWLVPRHGWRLAAIVALAMLDAAEDVAALREGSLGVKWPNDLVAEPAEQRGALRKFSGVLGETVTSADRLETAVVGIGTNVAWDPASFPPELAATMTSLAAVAHGRPTDRDRLLDAFLSRLEPRYVALCEGRFDSAGWSVRQRTTGRYVEAAVGGTVVAGIGSGIDPQSGALLVVTSNGIRAVDAGEVVRCTLSERIVPDPAAGHPDPAGGHPARNK